MLELQQLISLFGSDAQEKIMSGDLSIIEDMKNLYNDTASQSTSLQLQIEANEKAIEQIEKYAEKWNGSSKTIQQAKQSIEQVVTDNVKEIESIQKRVETVNTINDAWEQTRIKLEEELGFIKDNQIVAKDEESVILEERLNNIKKFSKQASDYLNQISNALSQAESKQSELNKVTNSNNKKTKELNLKTNTMSKKHSGLETGYVGESSNKKKDTFKYIALNKLKPEEIPNLLLKGEAVVNPKQKGLILDNMKNSFISGLNNASLMPLKPKTESVNKSIEFNGDIILNNVNDTNTLAKKIKNEFLIRLDQEFYK